MSADVARGDAKDYSTFHIIDTTEGEVVAEYKGKIRPDIFADLIFEFGIKYNKALVCPENNSYGFATILKLIEMNYPRMYYRKRNNTVYMGTYVPKSSAETAGFNTNGKTRSTVLAKLEETIRNKQLTIYSSRFYEEVKVFTWSSGRAQAKKGFNDDLVISLAIGSWLYDGSADYSKSSKKINEAMLNAFSVRQNTYQGTPQTIFDNPITTNGKDLDQRIDKSNIKQNLKKTLTKNKIPPEFLWVIK
jgi:hypothetical protein